MDNKEMTPRYLLERCECSGIFDKSLADHIKLVLKYTEAIIKQLGLSDIECAIQYAAVLHDIGKTKCAPKKEYGKGHENRGWKFLRSENGEKLLNAYGVISKQEEVAEYVWWHQDGNDEFPNSYIIMAADKLAHYEKESERCYKSIEAIKSIPDKLLADCCMEFAKEIALEHELINSKKIEEKEAKKKAKKKIKKKK